MRIRLGGLDKFPPSSVLSDWLEGVRITAIERKSGNSAQMSLESPTLAELLDMPSLAAAVPTASIPSLLGQLESVRAVLLARLINVGAPAPLTSIQVPSGTRADHLLTPAEAATRMGVTIRWLYQHHRAFPFAKKLSRRVLRFDEAGLHRWLAHRHG